MKSFIRESKLQLLLLIALTILILCPLLMIFTKAVFVNGRFDFTYAFEIIFKNENIQTVFNSLSLAFWVVIVSSLISLPLAFLLSKTDLGRHHWLDLILMIPFMTPPYISSMGWILFMQKNGLLQQLLPSLSWLTDAFFSFGGLVLVMSLHVFPFMLSLLKNAMLNVPASLDEAAALFGLGFMDRIRKVLLPLVSGNFAIGALLVFVKTLSEYGTPATLGQRIGFTVFTTDIHRYSTTSPIDFGRSASLSVILILICLLLWRSQNKITEKKTYRLVSGKGSRTAMITLKGKQKISAWLFIGFILLLALGIPYFSVISTSFIKLRGYGLALDNFTFCHYLSLFTENTKAVKAIQTTFMLAFSSAMIASLFGTAAVLIIRKKNRLSKVLEAVSLLPEMLPSIVLVIGIMLFYNQIYTWLPIYNTLGMMIIAYVILYLPYTIQYVTSAMTQISDSLMQAGKTFGGSPLMIFKRITLPLIFKGILSGWIMTFIISLRELVAASMIAPPSVLTISTFIVREFEQGSVSSGMAMAVLCVLLTTISLLILKIFERKTK